jgi:hypothetical protein
MEKILISTNKKNRYGNLINYEGHILKFDLSGVTEVTDPEVAKFLLSQKGFEQVRAEGSSKIIEFNSIKPVVGSELVDSLNEEINKLRSVIKELELENESLKALLSGGDDITDVVPELSGIPNTNDEIIQEIEKKNKRDLIQLCQEMNFPEEEYKILNSRDLKDYIIGKLKEEE